MSTQVFPSLSAIPGLNIKITRNVTWDTIVQEAVSGKETRVARRQYPRRQFTLTYNFLRSSTTWLELQTLEGFFNGRQGMFDSFLWSDPEDNGSSNYTFAQGDSTTINFQLQRNWGSFVEPVYAPNQITRLLVAGSSVSSTQFTFTQWGTTSALGPGVVSFSTIIPGNGQAIAADFTYYWPVRFTMDNMDFDRIVTLIWEGKKVEFLSII